jgi:hypothetical protein
MEILYLKERLYQYLIEKKYNVKHTDTTLKMVEALIWWIWWVRQHDSVPLQELIIKQTIAPSYNIIFDIEVWRKVYEDDLPDHISQFLNTQMQTRNGIKSG